MDVDDSLNMHFSAEADVSDLDPEGNQPLCKLEIIRLFLTLMSLPL